MDNPQFKDLVLGAKFNKVNPDFVNTIVFVKVTPWHGCEITVEGGEPRVLRFDQEQPIKVVDRLL